MSDTFVSLSSLSLKYVDDEAGVDDLRLRRDDDDPLSCKPALHRDYWRIHNSSPDGVEIRSGSKSRSQVHPAK